MKIVLVLDLLLTHFTPLYPSTCTLHISSPYNYLLTSVCRQLLRVRVCREGTVDVPLAHAHGREALPLQRVRLRGGDQGLLGEAHAHAHWGKAVQMQILRVLQL